MINFYTPIPPAKTGTANYARLLLRDLRKQFACEDVRIIVDGSYPLGSDYDGIPLLSYHQFMPHINDINIFAIANNEFHHYIIDALIKNDMKERKNISIIHDVQILQNLTSLLLNKKYNITEEIYNNFFDKELPTHLAGHPPSVWILGGHLYNILKYTTMGLNSIIENSEHILVHSYYARNKIRIESGFSEEKLQTIEVIAHPLEDNTIESIPTEAPTNDLQFKIGCFGWIGEHKRIHTIIEAYARLCHSWPEFLKKSELVIAGQLPDQDYFDPRSIAEDNKIAQKVRFTGFLSHENFLAELRGIDLQFNLRYPSCGETSGTLYAGRAFSRYTAITNYQSFREETATFHVSVEPTMEKAEIALIMRRSFEYWLEGESQLSMSHHSLPKPDAAVTLRSLFARYGA